MTPRAARAAPRRATGIGFLTPLLLLLLSTLFLGGAEAAKAPGLLRQTLVNSEPYRELCLANLAFLPYLWAIYVRLTDTQPPPRRWSFALFHSFMVPRRAAAAGETVNIESAEGSYPSPGSADSDGACPGHCRTRGSVAL